MDIKVGTEDERIDTAIAKTVNFFGVTGHKYTAKWISELAGIH